MTVTELQHDFKSLGITETAINKSEDFNDDELLKLSVLSDEKLVAKSDKGITKSIFGADITAPDGSEMGDDNVRRWNTRYEKNGITYVRKWEIRTSTNYTLRGESLVKKLGIPNKSIAIVDFDKGFFARLKLGKWSPFTLYYCINSITRADSAGKININGGHGKEVFSGLKGITCKAIISDQKIVAFGNRELRMNYKIENIKTNYRVGNRKDIIKQIWTPLSDKLETFEVEDPHIYNNKTSLKDSIRSIVNFDGTLDRPDINTIEAFLQKRSGDQLQCWITKYLLKKITDPLEVIYYFKPNINWSKSQQDDINIQQMYTNEEMGDIFTLTHDFLYLCFCVECLGTSVIFQNQDQFIYYRRVK